MNNPSKIQDETTEKIKIILDTDPGVDDAIAFMYCVQSGDFDIKLLSTEGGNAPIEIITQNALFLTQLFKTDIPVVQGYGTPLERKPAYAVSAQGKKGLGGFNYNPKKIKRNAIKGEACDVLYQTLKDSNEKLSIVSIGPMTNLAKMLLKYPDSKKYIKQIVFESGTKEKIYGKPYKSFNVGYDPEAASVIFKSGIKLVMIPMELGHFAYLDHDDIKRFKKTNKIGKIYAKMFSKYHDYHVGSLGAAVHDVCAVYYLNHPEYFKTEKTHISIKYYKTDDGDFGYIDTDFDKKPNATICMDLNILAFKYDLFKALESCGDLK